jgi:hypothetical protein
VDAANQGDGSSAPAAAVVSDPAQTPNPQPDSGTFLAMLTLAPLAPADATNGGDGSSAPVAAPSDPAQTPAVQPGNGTVTATVAAVVAGGVTDPGSVPPAAPGPVAGAAVTVPAAPGLAEPNIAGVDGDQYLNYTVRGTIADPNPTALTIKITVDGLAEPSARPDASGRFTVTFTLPPCSSATNATRFGTAVATDGARVSPTVLFDFAQMPRS